MALLVVLLCWLLPGPTFIGEVLSVFVNFLELVRALGPCILWLGSALLEINSYLSKKKKKKNCMSIEKELFIQMYILYSILL